MATLNTEMKDVVNDVGHHHESIAKLSSVKLALQQLRPHAVKSESRLQTKKHKKRARTLSQGEDDAEEGEDIVALDVGPTSVCGTTVKEDFSEWQVDERLAVILQDKFEISNLFSLQQYAIRMMIQQEDRDACISAPTGSGKTLIYTIPLVHALSGRIVTRCRGLVLVPSRELARQVYAVVSVVSAAVGLECGLVAGESSLLQEAKSLVHASSGDGKHHSLVDIVVATPGRLLDHVDKTQGFTLEHLELLVVDEADRMLTQSYNDWLDRVYRAANREPCLAEQVVLRDDSIIIPDQRNFRSNTPSDRISVADYLAQDGKRMRRILCSATLTSNPQKLAALSLRRPILVDSNSLAAENGGEAGEEYKLPKTLVELEYKVTTSNKPLVLLHVVGEVLDKDKAVRILVFASSVERASRVHSLLSSVLGSKKCALISSDLSRQERMEALERFKSRKIRVLVASDLAARGIDVPGLEYVLSYDVPSHATTYVHRAGRTARAGTSGTSIVLLRGDQGRHFRQIKIKLGLEELRFIRVPEDDVEKVKPAFEQWRASSSNNQHGED